MFQPIEDSVYRGLFHADFQHDVPHFQNSVRGAVCIDYLGLYSLTYRKDSPLEGVILNQDTNTYMRVVRVRSKEGEVSPPMAIHETPSGMWIRLFGYPHHDEMAMHDMITKDFGYTRIS